MDQFAFNVKSNVEIIKKLESLGRGIGTYSQPIKNNKYVLC